jgi:2-polyprenyl-3-methyl-5-hydroxy-6-metoxy-1,4-benzoquinol methylase
MSSEPAGSYELREDLVDLASYAFRLAQENCTQCREYHSIWGYERLAEVKGNTFESERDILGPLIRDRLAQEGRVLIAGAADAGLLAFVMQEARSRAPRITVADVCATPLAVCRRHAQSHGLQIATVQQDLTKDPLATRHDLVFAHNILLHLPPHLWSAFLRNIRLCLDRNGALILVHSMRPQDPAPALPVSTGYAARALAALAARKIELPENEALFRRRLESRVRVYSAAGLAHLEACLTEAGFAVARRIDHDRRKVNSGLEGGEVKPVLTHIFILAAEHS